MKQSWMCGVKWLRSECCDCVLLIVCSAAFDAVNSWIHSSFIHFTLCLLCVALHWSKQSIHSFNEKKQLMKWKQLHEGREQRKWDEMRGLLLASCRSAIITHIYIDGKQTSLFPASFRWRIQYSIHEFHSFHWMIELLATSWSSEQI